MSQNKQILKALQQGRRLTPLAALQEFGCFRLGARIYDLRKEGYEIESELKSENGKQYSEYYLRGEG